jgi:hypothetical protein
MSCTTCIKVDCTETSSLPKYLGGYSLSNGTFAQNAQPITVTTTNQTGPTTITFPPGSIQLSIPTPVPTSPFTFVAVMKQCQASFTIQIPPTQNAAFFDEVIAALAQQLGDCLNSSATPGGGSIHQYVNSPQTISCPGGAQMLLCNPSLSFPQGITFNSAGNGSLTIVGGICVASTLASANQGALNLLQAFLTNMINSQNMICGGPCPQTCAQALAALTWSVVNGSTGGDGMASGSVTPSGSGFNFAFSAQVTTATEVAVTQGAISFTATIQNQTNSPCTYILNLDVTSHSLPGEGVEGNTGNLSVGLVGCSTGSCTNFTNNIFTGTYGGFGDENPVIFSCPNGTITVPANSSLNLDFFAQASLGGANPSGGTLSVAGTATLFVV